MKYRLVALDLDGTLLDSEMRIRSETIEALVQARAQGVQAMIVTGRHHVAAYPYWYQLGLDLPAICCNGAYVYDFNSRRPLIGDPLTRREARELLKLVRKYDISSMVYVDEVMAYENESEYHPYLLKWSATLPEALRPRIEKVDSFEGLVEEAGNVWKFASAGEDEQVMRAFVSEIEQSLGLSCEWSGNYRLDITHAGNSKGVRLAEWIAEQGIAREEVIAFGDQNNDFEMLRMAGMGVAMGNSGAEVQACADWVTGTNDSDGIAAALNRFVLAPA
jgi:Cof subfamily protein (haloacid dehalogenase superfamily)